MTIALLALAMTSARPLVVMIHGAGGGGWEYVTWKPIFEEAGYDVAAPDLIPGERGLEKTNFDDYVRQIVKAGDGKPTILIGASMGGALALKAAETLHPQAIVLVCSTSPAPPGEKQAGKYPPIMYWKNGPYSDTVDSMPDSDEEMRKYAWPRWRDESGAVLDAIARGITAQKPKCPVLSIIPEGDTTIPPKKQEALAKWCGADVIHFKGMSHVGPLLSRSANEVAVSVVRWIEKRVK